MDTSNDEDQEFDLFQLSAQEEQELKSRSWPVVEGHGLQQRRVRYLRQQHPVHVFDCLDASLLQVANSIQGYTRQRHSAFPTIDIPIAGHALESALTNLILPRLETYYGFEPGDLEFLDLFIVKYDEEQSSLAPHTDGCLISFNVLLNDPAEFSGGGTHFCDSNETIFLKQGQCVCHDSRRLHQGLPIKGIRKILVGFVETKRKGPLSKQGWIKQAF